MRIGRYVSKEGKMSVEKMSHVRKKGKEGKNDKRREKEVKKEKKE